MIIHHEILGELPKYLRCSPEVKTIVIASGSFDMANGNHINYLNDAVSLKSADRPIYDQEMRAWIVDNLKAVDYTVIVPYNPHMTAEIKADNQEQEQWLTMFEPMLKALCTAKDEDIKVVWYHEDAPKLASARKRLFAKYGVNGVAAPRGKGASTTKIIKRVKGEGGPIGMK